MSQQKVYLKPNVQAEPLFNQWYAWPYLIAPATASMYMTNSYFKIMESFVAAPQFHVSALQNPKMKGGPFINYDASKVDEIKALLEKTQAEQEELVELAEGLKKLHLLLMEEAKGYSMEPLYERVPEVLKGYVELSYDLNNLPSARLIEGLLYKSKYYKTSSQSLSLSLVEKDDRPFIFSTPRLEDEQSLPLDVHFRHEGLDELFEMKQTPKPLGAIEEVLNINNGHRGSLWRSFFTEDAPAPLNKYTEEPVRVRYFGHACILIESKDVSILCDPLISYKYEGGIDRYTYSDLPEVIDYLLITHQHHDHFMLETLLQLRHKTKTAIVPKNNGGELADPSMKLLLQNIGFRQVIEIEEMETIEVEGGSITGLPFLGEHADIKIRSKTAYAIDLQDKAIVVGADSTNCEYRLYDNIKGALGKVDLVFLGVQCDGAPLSWAYGGLLIKPLARKMDQSRKSSGSDYEKGLALIESLQPQEVYVYAMGYEPWLSYLMHFENYEQSRSFAEANKLVSECQSRGIVSERLYGQRELYLTP